MSLAEEPADRLDDVVDPRVQVTSLPLSLALPLRLPPHSGLRSAYASYTPAPRHPAVPAVQLGTLLAPGRREIAPACPGVAGPD